MFVGELKRVARSLDEVMLSLAEDDARRHDLWLAAQMVKAIDAPLNLPDCEELVGEGFDEGFGTGFYETGGVGASYMCGDTESQLQAAQWTWRAARLKELGL